MDGTPVEIKRGRKYDQVVAGARTVFLAEGFEGASVDLIAKEAEVSKATLYSYFPDKRMLFIEVAKEECARQADRALLVEDADQPVRDVLIKMATSMMAFLTSSFAQRIFRICVAETDRFPELGQEFYRSGPQLMEERLSAYFTYAVQRGELRIDDVRLAAQQFDALMKADVFIKMVFNVVETPDPKAMDRVIEGAVDTFLARYGV